MIASRAAVTAGTVATNRKEVVRVVSILDRIELVRSGCAACGTPGGVLLMPEPAGGSVYLSSAEELTDGCCLGCYLATYGPAMERFLAPRTAMGESVRVELARQGVAAESALMAFAYNPGSADRKLAPFRGLVFSAHGVCSRIPNWHEVNDGPLWQCWFTVAADDRPTPRCHVQVVLGVVLWRPDVKGAHLQFVADPQHRGSAYRLSVIGWDSPDLTDEAFSKLAAGRRIMPKLAAAFPRPGRPKGSTKVTNQAIYTAYMDLWREKGKPPSQAKVARRLGCSADAVRANLKHPKTGALLSWADFEVLIQHKAARKNSARS